MSFAALCATAALLFVSCSVSSVSAVSESSAQSEFSNFVKRYNKQYSHEEFFPRFATFKQNLNKIEQHNAGNHTYTLGVNEFADLTFDEFHAKMTGYNRRDQSYLRSKNTVQLPIKDLPASVDWSAAGAVTPIKNQQQCGSCWSFSTTGSVEGAWFLAGNALVSLSEQQLVDCSTAQGNQGCNGGLMDDAFQWIISNKGICSEDSYPYTATGPNTCQTTCESVAHIDSYADVTSGDENALQAAVAVQPVSIAIEADQQVFQLYSGGVLSDSGCGTALDHGVLLVGYGTDSSSGQNFWKIKNSWGASWGEAGYIRVIRGTNECGLAQQPSYPIINKTKKNSFSF